MKISLPALPTLIHYFHTTPSIMKLAVSLYFACYASSQLFWGALSEKYGRRPSILSGLLIAVMGTLITMFAQNSTIYILGRCIEGIGIGVASPVGRAVITDLFDIKEISKILAIVGCINGLMPALAPIAGGFIIAEFGWRYIFLFFLVLSTGYLIWAFYKLPETHDDRNTHKLSMQFKGYLSILRESTFWKYLIGYALTQGALLGYYGAMPFWYVDQWKLSEDTYAFLALFTVGAYLFALLLTRKLVNRIQLETLLKFALWSSLGSAFLGVVFSAFNFFGITALVIVMTLFALTPGIAFPVANARLMHHFRNQAAMLSALSATMMFLTASIFSWIESHLLVHNLWQLSSVLIVVAIIALASYYRLGNIKKEQSIESAVKEH